MPRIRFSAPSRVHIVQREWPGPTSPRADDALTELRQVARPAPYAGALSGRQSRVVSPAPTESHSGTSPPGSGGWATSGRATPMSAWVDEPAASSPPRAAPRLRLADLVDSGGGRLVVDSPLALPGEPVHASGTHTRNHSEVTDADMAELVQTLRRQEVPMRRRSVARIGPLHHSGPGTRDNTCPPSPTRRIVAVLSRRHSSTAIHAVEPPVAASRRISVSELPFERHAIVPNEPEAPHSALAEFETDSSRLHGTLWQASVPGPHPSSPSPVNHVETLVTATTVSTATITLSSYQTACASPASSVSGHVSPESAGSPASKLPAHSNVRLVDDWAK